jgi:CubicO group peptidase (beta-lactamase class C family)
VALVELESLDGAVHRRSIGFAKVPPLDLRGWPAPELGEPARPVSVPEGLGLSPRQRRELERQIWAGGIGALGSGPAAAATRARLLELESEEAKPDQSAWLGGSIVRDAEHRLSQRMITEGRSARPLASPVAVAEGAPALRVGSDREAGMRAGSSAQIRKLAKQWAKEDPNGFVVLVARKGVVFFHEGFNGFEPETKFSPASLGKTIFGLLFARAVDQGLIELDQKVGEILPDWSHGKLAEVTFRNLFNHVAGLSGHASHGGLRNAYLDNALALQDARFSEPRARFRYNGDDLNLAAQALELTTGTHAFRLLYDNLQQPFDSSVLQFDMGFGHAFSAIYLARVGQMVLQDGAYDGKRYYSPGFLKTLWPKPISESIPGFEGEEEWGIGFEWMVDPEGPRSQAALGPNVIGHGAASGSVWRIVPDHDLVIVVGRNRFAGAWGDNERRIDRFVVGLAETL